MTEDELKIAQKLLPRDWTPLVDVVLRAGAFFKRDLDLVMINRYLHEGLLELKLVRPDSTTTEFSKKDCAHLTISAPFHRAEGVRVEEPYQAGQYLGRLAELTSPATATPPAERQFPAAGGSEPSQSSQAKQQSEPRQSPPATQPDEPAARAKEPEPPRGGTGSPRDLPADRQLSGGPEPSQSPQAQRQPQQSTNERESASDDAQPQPEVHKLSGKNWVPKAYARRSKELLAMGITGASEALAKESDNAADCAKPLTARYIEKLLREPGTFLKAHRGSPKQRPK
jgi:hypothetical protein